MLEKLGDIGTEPVEVSPGQWEMEFETRRNQELLLFSEYTKGDEDGILISFFSKDTNISNDYFTVSVARPGSPIKLVPYIIEMDEDQNPRFSLPIGMRDKYFKVRVDFIGAGADPGTLKLGARMNELY